MRDPARRSLKGTTSIPLLDIRALLLTCLRAENVEGLTVGGWILDARFAARVARHRTPLLTLNPTELVPTRCSWPAWPRAVITATRSLGSCLVPHLA